MSLQHDGPVLDTPIIVPSHADAARHPANCADYVRCPFTAASASSLLFSGIRQGGHANGVLQALPMMPEREGTGGLDG
jgi:hypothetical protein